MIQLKQPKIRYLDQDQIRKIIECIPNNETGLMYKTMIAVFYSTGLRLSELLGLKVSDLKLEPKQIKETQELPVTGKGGKTRPIYFSPDTLKAIKKYIQVRKKESEYVFPAGIRAVQIYIKKYSDWAGFIGVHPHVFRHSFAVRVLSRTNNLRICQELLGHSNPNTTMIYTTLTNKVLEKAHKEVFD